MFSAHPSGGEVGVLGDVGKVLELQSLSGRCVAHGEDLQDIFIAVPWIIHLKDDLEEDGEL